MSACDFVQLQVECDGVCQHNYWDGVSFGLDNSGSSPEQDALYGCNHTITVTNESFVECSYQIIVTNRSLVPCGDYSGDPSVVYCDITTSKLKYATSGIYTCL